MKRVTAWYKRVDDDWVFNHISDGHAESDAPEPISKRQRKAWSKTSWKPVHAYLGADCVVQVLEDTQQ